MRIVFECPGCQKTGMTEVGPNAAVVSCPQCSWSRPLAEENRAETEPTSCVVCGCQDLWRQKDFPQRVGVAMVVAGALISTVFWWRMEPLWAIGVLLVFALIDLVLYSVMPDVLVCYRCNARHRGTPLVGRNERFNLEKHERYRQESIRLEEAFQARAPITKSQRMSNSDFD